MSVNVDPFVIPIPQKWLTDPELSATVQYLWKFLYDMWSRTGGGNDAIANLEDSALYDVGIKGAEIAEIMKALDDLRIQIAFTEGADRALIEAVAPRQFYVQDTQPVITGIQYLWVQTGLPGGGITLWAEDGT